jgi:hypothetical protein
MPAKPTQIRVKPTGTQPVPLPVSMRKPGRMSSPVSGATVTLTRFIQRRLDANDLALVTDAPPPAATTTPAKGS